MCVLMVVHPDLQDVEICHHLRLTMPDTRYSESERERSLHIYMANLDAPWKEDSQIFQVVPWKYDYSKTAQGCRPAAPPSPY